MKYQAIKKQDMLNGDGIRVSFWCSGCPHRCIGCHNPETWDKDLGILVTKDTYKELALALDQSYISGITWTGGDCLHPDNRQEIEDLIMFVHDNFNKTQWLYTGYHWNDIKNLNIIKYLDVVVDGPYIEELRDISLKWRGSSNQRVIDVRKSLETGQVVLWCD
jgi:anaerobic ribonucleoside-triphosphate reductase activating protein